MCKRSCLFEEKLKDKRFVEREKAIYAVCLEGDVSDVDILARRAGVSRATFYRHHGSIENVTKDYEELLGVRMEKWIGKVGLSGAPMIMLFREVLVFVLKNERLFRFLILKGRENPFYLLMERIKPVITRENRLLGDETVYRIYAAEIVAVLSMWGEEEFDKDMMRMILENMVFLTRTAGIRLSPLKGVGEEK